MDVLVIGSGGREHTLAWCLARSTRVKQVYVAPGNGGTAVGMINVPIKDTDIDALVAFAAEHDVGMTMVGPEVPLAAGIVDRFQAAGLRAFGPGKDAARMEGSKAFAKQFMARHDIPTARFAVFTDVEAAQEHLGQVDYEVVIKASGLAAGKGVLLPEGREQALAALDQVMVERAFGDAGERVVIEERMRGREASVLAFCDGKDLAVMPVAQDHKRVFEGDRGPNTGGMGAFAPSPFLSPELLDKITRDVLRRTMEALAAEGMPYVGVLYAGLMLTDDGPRVLEFNCRFGDPETQVLLPLLDSDLLDVLEACVEGRLANTPVRWKDSAAATVVAAAPGYPDSYPKGLPISGLQQAGAREGVVVFHAGTRLEEDGGVVTSGGRVLAVTGLGPDLSTALQRAYGGINEIRFEGLHFRGDIGGTRIES